MIEHSTSYTPETFQIKQLVCFLTRLGFIKTRNNKMAAMSFHRYYSFRDKDMKNFTV